MSADTDACISCDVGWVLVLQPRSRYRPLFPNGLIFKVVKTKWSGRVDSNHRPPGPEPGALARLSHAPTLHAPASVRRKTCAVLPNHLRLTCDLSIASSHPALYLD